MPPHRTQPHNRTRHVAARETWIDGVKRPIYRACNVLHTPLREIEDTRPHKSPPRSPVHRRRFGHAFGCVPAVSSIPERVYAGTYCSVRLSFIWKFFARARALIAHAFGLLVVGASSRNRLASRWRLHAHDVRPRRPLPLLLRWLDTGQTVGGARWHVEFVRHCVVFMSNQPNTSRERWASFVRVLPNNYSFDCSASCYVSRCNDTRLRPVGKRQRQRRRRRLFKPIKIT